MELLPLLEGAKFIIIDEGFEVPFAETLITGWLKMWEKRKPDCKINIISFSNPKYLYVQHFNSLTVNNVNVIDFYSTTSQDETDSFTEKLNEYFETDIIFDTVIINCLSTLSLSVGLEKAVLFIEKMKEKSKQVIGIYRRDFGKVNLPNIETMVTTYVKLDGHLKATQINDFIYEGNYTHRKLGGSVIRQTELVTQNVKTYEIKSTKILKDSVEKLRKTAPEKPKEVKASFRIEMNDQEMSQKNDTPLPYIEVKNQNKSTIFYQLEDFDDDEGDDLDDDLEI
ncbi:uncharacterized protein LOC122501363 [Leptopilina heterotoma]|uniref:uncharacterized protein LOC122501363 n=1 Tax=Leptopilina heterotoma TaxID=63436 RepID=UPI001CA97937|nr:uncharacterized protein LOC122501363 [Leptopilina heterotoma]